MAKKATYIQAKVSGSSTVESFEIVDKGARENVSSLATRVAALESQPAPQDGTNGKSAYQSYLDTTSDSPALSEADWVASLHGANGTNGTNGQDGTSVTVTEVANGVEVYDGTNYVTITNGQDGSDGASVSVKSSTKFNGVTTVVLTDGTTDTTITINDGADGADGQDGITPTITPNSGNTVTYNSTSGQYELASGASSHVYKLNITAGSSTITTPNLLFGTDAILEAIDAIINETPTIISGE